MADLTTRRRNLIRGGIQEHVGFFTHSAASTEIAAAAANTQIAVTGIMLSSSAAATCAIKGDTTSILPTFFLVADTPVHFSIPDGMAIAPDGEALDFDISVGTVDLTITYVRIPTVA